MPRRGDDLNYWLTDKKRDEQVFKLGQDMDEVIDRLRTVETALIELQSKQLAAKKGLPLPHKYSHLFKQTA